MSLLNYISMEVFRSRKRRSILLLILVEILIMVLCYIQNREGFFSTQGILMSPYYNLQITARYIFAALVVNEIFLVDIEAGMFKTVISIGYGRVKLLIIKTIKCVVLLLIPQLVSNSIFGLMGSYFNADIKFFVAIFIDIFINSMPLISYILVIIFINMITRSTSITYLCSFISVFFIQLLPYDVAKYLLPTYNNLKLVWSYSDNESKILMFAVLGISTIVFAILNGVYIIKVDI